MICLIIALALSGFTNISGNSDINLNQTPEGMNGNKVDQPINKPPFCLPNLTKK